MHLATYKIPPKICLESVRCELNVSMNHESIIFILLVGVLRFQRVTCGMCLLRSTSSVESCWFQCIRSNDYLEDVKRAPTDVNLISFTGSSIPVVYDESFTRLHKNLKTVIAVNSGIEEIEENAFKGLANLRTIILRYNKLKVVKGSWFKGLANIEMVLLSHNQIKHIEDDFFTNVRRLEYFDISDNQLASLPADSISKLNASALSIWYNPLSSHCVNSLLDSLDARRYAEASTWVKPDRDISPKILSICRTKPPSNFQQDEEGFVRCAGKKIREYLLAKGNYTVKETFQILTDDLFPSMGYVTSN